MDEVTFEVRGRVGDAALSTLVGLAFETPDVVVTEWSRRLERHSLTWVAASERGELVGFVNVVWDGGKHAFLLDTAVHPRFRRRGIAAELVRIAVAESRGAGCGWLHVDFEPRLAGLYGSSLGFRSTAAAVIDLRGDA